VLPVEARDLYILDNRSDAKELAKNMTVAGDPRPGSGCSAHHIVPSNESRPFARQYVENARRILESCGISLNDAVNGVWLPQNRNSTCIGSYHPQLHNGSYYETISNMLSEAYDAGDNHEEGCRNVIDSMRNIRNMLKLGRL
jgi:hypothetical protein